ncbi:NADH-ubiquinone oxidoreductase 21.3 kDa subunit, partial [Lachnellula suecica]
KYTVQSTGIWETIRRFFAVDPTRSNGVPLNPQFRNPPPGSNDPFAFVDPVTLPAGDIAENPYWKRDARRNYPQLSFVNQADAVALLSVGSQSAPKKELIGEEGSKALVQAKEEGAGGLAKHFERVGKGGVLEALGKGGLPPLPSGASLKEGADKYNLTKENAYPEQYPCRTFQ